jgi:hypothetical protein
MQRTSKVLVAALFVSLAAVPFAGQRLLAADKPAADTLPTLQATWQVSPTAIKETPKLAVKPPAKLLQPKADATMDKLKDLRTHLGRALSIACDLFSGNEAELFSNNKAAILSGNSPALLSGNKPAILSGNTTPILSGNSLSVLSNIKIEIHIENSGNNHPPHAPAAGHIAPATTTTAPTIYLPTIAPTSNGPGTYPAPSTYATPAANPSPSLPASR